MNEYVAGMFGRYNLLKPSIAALFGIESNGKNLMLRPEEFVIDKSEGVKGVVQKISFWGSFYEVELLVEDVNIVVRMRENKWKIGNEVWIIAKK